MKVKAPEEMQSAQTLVWIAENVGRGKDRIQKARKRLDDLLAESENPPASKDGYDYKSDIFLARENLEFEENQHFKWLAKQQLFDKSVPESKRDASESISRNEGARCFSMFAIYMRTACESYTTRIIPEIRESKSNEDAYAIAASSLRECLVIALTSALRENHLPAWCKEAVEGVL